MSPLPSGLLDLLPAHLNTQRWYAGRSSTRVARVGLEWGAKLWEGGAQRLWHAIVVVGEDRYQLFVGERPAGEAPEFLHGKEEALLGGSGGSLFYDATVDLELARMILEVASGGEQHASRARPVGAEQSNTSLVYDDRVILKLFRRLQPGPNPDVEVTTTLAGVGFPHVATPLVVWRDHGFDLAFGQQFLAGGSEGWALALTSIRDLYNSQGTSPADAGGDFAGEAFRLGRVTAEMHQAMAEGFGLASAADTLLAWTRLVDGLPARLDAAGRLAGRDFLAAGRPLLDRLGSLDDPGRFLRVHGDYHLGQVMRTDSGWYVLDFEGEPARDLSERVGFSSPFKDVSSMLRSFHYASRHVLAERPAQEAEPLADLALAWESHNRQAFLEGYRQAPGIQSRLPPPEVAPAVLLAYELDKALYELDYERAHRPEWVSIPLDALARLLYEGSEVG